MNIKREGRILGFLISISLLLCISFIKNTPFSLLDTGRGYYYYSIFFDNKSDFRNTNNLEEINGRERDLETKKVFDFVKHKGDSVFIRFQYGLPFQEDSDTVAKYGEADIALNKKFSKKIPYFKNPGFRLQEINGGPITEAENFTVSLFKISQSEFKEKMHSLLRRMEVSVIPYENRRLFHLPAIFSFVFFCFFLYGALSLLKIKNISVYVSLVTLIFISSILFYAVPFKKELFFLLSIMAFIILCIVSIKKRDYLYLPLAAFLIILLIATTLRWQEVLRLSVANLDPDARVYLRYAREMKMFSPQHGFFSGTYWIRAPFFPFILKPIAAIFDYSSLSIRFCSFFLSILSILITYILGRRIFKNEIIPLISSGLLALSSSLIWESPRGVRTELETILLLLFAYFAFVRRGGYKTWVFCTGIIGGLWVLTRDITLIGIIPLIIVSALIKGWQLRHAIKRSILAVIILIFLFLPYGINKYANYYQDSDGSFYATVFARYERIIPPDYAGMISIKDYLFKYHTVKELVIYPILGAPMVYFQGGLDALNLRNLANHVMKLLFAGDIKLVLDSPFVLIRLFLGLLILFLSACRLLFSKDYRFILAVILFATAYSIFLQGASLYKRMPIGDIHRMLAHTIPFIALSISFFLVDLFMRLKIYFNKLMRK